MPLPELVGEKGDGRQLDAAEIPRKQVVRVEEGFMKEQDHVRKQGEVDPDYGAFVVHG